MTYRVLIVGLGQIGLGYDLGGAPAEQVYSHARAVSRHPAFTLVGAGAGSTARRASAPC